MNKKDVFWNLTKLLSYNRIFNIAIGSRGCGKSFAGKKWCIKDFLDNGKQFVYLRRSEVELKLVKDSFFRDIIKEEIFQDTEFGVEGNIYYINKKVAGYALALSTCGNVKSNSFAWVNKIVFDEFLIDKTMTQSYLKNEPSRLVGLYETIDRGRDETRVLMLANAMSVVNPYFVKWGIKFNRNAKFMKTGKEIVTEIVVNQAYLDWKNSTRFGQFLYDVNEDEHIINNKFKNDNYSFIEKITGHLNYCFTCIYDGQNIGVWYSQEMGVYYCSGDTRKGIYTFSFSTYDHQLNSIMFKNAKNNKMMKNLMLAYDYGQVRYENINIKSTMMELFDYV